MSDTERQKFPLFIEEKTNPDLTHFTCDDWGCNAETLCHRCMRDDWHSITGVGMRQLCERCQKMADVINTNIIIRKDKIKRTKNLDEFLEEDKTAASKWNCCAVCAMLPNSIKWESAYMIVSYIGEKYGPCMIASGLEFYAHIDSALIFGAIETCKKICNEMEGA